MKIKTISALMLGLLMLICSCSVQKTGEISESDRIAKQQAAFTADDMKYDRPVWEGLLYAGFTLGTTDTGNSDFRGLALCYTLTHYGCGSLTDKHSDEVNANASASRKELELLACAMFGKDASLSDADLSGYFNVSDEIYTAKGDISFEQAEYSEDLVLMISGKKSTGFIKMSEDNYLSLTFTFEKNPDIDSPYTLCISEIAAAN